jgi:hypothetical protein
MPRVTIDSLKVKKIKLKPSDYAARPWTPDEVALLKELRARGVKIRVIAKILGRTYRAVDSKINKGLV